MGNSKRFLPQVRRTNAEVGGLDPRSGRSDIKINSMEQHLIEYDNRSDISLSTRDRPSHATNGLQTVPPRLIDPRLM